MKFKKGDKVVLVDNTGHFALMAEIGATAIVEGYKKHDRIFYVDIKWIRNGQDNGTEDGHWHTYRFECARKTGEECFKCERRLQCITEGE